MLPFWSPLRGTEKVIPAQGNANLPNSNKCLSYTPEKLFKQDSFRDITLNHLKMISIFRKYFYDLFQKDHVHASKDFTGYIIKTVNGIACTFVINTETLSQPSIRKSDTCRFMLSHSPFSRSESTDTPTIVI